ncbi:MAG: hypothetical protein EBS22_07920 [Acidimicrobiia bacterium]|nr:hypothetical protein [Acidimicrobiia bacterium]
MGTAGASVAGGASESVGADVAAGASVAGAAVVAASSLSRFEHATVIVSNAPSTKAPRSRRRDESVERATTCMVPPLSVSTPPRRPVVTSTLATPGVPASDDFCYE